MEMGPKRCVRVYIADKRENMLYKGWGATGVKAWELEREWCPARASCQ